MTHALITGPIDGRIPTGDGKFLNVTPDVLFFDTHDDALAAANAIEAEHHARGSHPLQVECRYLDDPAEHPGGVPQDRIHAHRVAHTALNKRVGA